MLAWPGNLTGMSHPRALHSRVCCRPGPLGFLGRVEVAGNVAFPVNRRGGQRYEVHEVALLVPFLQLATVVRAKCDDLQEDFLTARTRPAGAGLKSTVQPPCPEERRQVSHGP